MDYIDGPLHELEIMNFEQLKEIVALKAELEKAKVDYEKLYAQYTNLINDGPHVAARKQFEAALEKAKAERDEIFANKCGWQDKATDYWKKLDIAVKALEFYADEDNWSLVDEQHCPAMIIGDDIRNHSRSSKRFVGGKTAREALEKLK